MSEQEKKAWIADQLTKSTFFHKKLHEWKLLDIAYELEKISGEKLKWDKDELNITGGAWDRLIHRGIKPIRGFAHPKVLVQNPRRVGYYRTLAMVSQKSMGRIGLSIESYETGEKKLNGKTAALLARHLNRIISALIEFDEIIDSREFDLWRGMSAGSQAQGSWQNIKGDKAEIIIKEIVRARLLENAVSKKTPHGKGEEIILKDGRRFIFGSEPDIGVYKESLIQAVLEIKGGIDPAGALERFGATLKSLGRSKRENIECRNILIVEEVSLTTGVKEEISQATAIDCLFTVEEIIENQDSRERLFKLLGI